MALGLCAILCRTAVATVFLLTAGWKLLHRSEFRASFERLAPWAGPLAPAAAVWPLAAAEAMTAVVLVAGVWTTPLHIVGPAAATALLVAFSVSLLRSAPGGCGCWSAPQLSPRATKYVPILRNVLLLLCLGVVWLSATVGFEAGDTFAVAAPIAAGVLFAGFLVDAPQIASVLLASNAAAGVRA